MCSWIVEAGEMTGSGKGPHGWFALSTAHVYYDHPYHAPMDHSLSIDFADKVRGPGGRVAVELSADSARELVRLINAALGSGDAQHQAEEPLNQATATLPVSTTESIR